MRCKPRITTTATCKPHPTNTFSIIPLPSSSPDDINSKFFSTIFSMATPNSRTCCANKAVQVLGLFGLLLLIQKGNSYEFKVGGSGDWFVPSDPNSAPYNRWASRSRFQVGDTLLFIYPADKDSVLQVTKDDYENCHTKSPLASYSDGHTVYKINQSGPHYFISGVEGHCKNNEKVVLVVMADRSNRNSSSPSKSPPSPAPSGDESPSPAPSGDESPSPPSSETNSAPAPSQVADNPPPPPPARNGATSIVVSSICSVGAFVGSALLLVF